MHDKHLSERSRCPTIEVVDVHTGGDLHRIVLGGIKPLPGQSVLEQMQYLKANGDGLRKLLLNEPRGGHPSLFADLVVPSVDPSADAGFIIMELMGYPLISGTNTMSTVIALLETGRIPMKDGMCPVTLEAPGGPIQAFARCVNGKVTAVTYEAQAPSFLVEAGRVAQVPGWGEVSFEGSSCRTSDRRAALPLNRRVSSAKESTRPIGNSHLSFVTLGAA